MSVKTLLIVSTLRSHDSSTCLRLISDHPPGGRWSRSLHRFSLQMGGASYIVFLSSIFVLTSFSHQTGQLTHINESCRLFNLGCCSAAGVSSADQGHRPTETSPEQLLADYQPRINLRCCWPMSIALNGCCCSFIHRVETLDIILVNSVVCWLASKLLSVLMFFE